LAHGPAKWHDDKAGDATKRSVSQPETPATLEHHCPRRVQATIVAIDPRAKTALGNRAHFLNKPHWVR
jgi:hypothetical protein